MEQYNVILTAAAMEQAIEAIFKFSIWFNVGWCFLYIPLGSWLKMRLNYHKSTPANNTTKRYCLIVAANIIYCVVFLNPWVLTVLTFVLWHADKNTTIGTNTLCIMLVAFYIWPSSIITDYLLMRTLPRRPLFKCFEYRSTPKQFLVANVVAILVGLIGGYSMVLIVQI